MRDDIRMDRLALAEETEFQWALVDQILRHRETGMATRKEAKTALAPIYGRISDLAGGSA